MEVKKKYRMKKNETSRLLRQWAMELANHLRYKEGWTADQAMEALRVPKKRREYYEGKVERKIAQG